jgi:ribonuclease VapC
MFVDASAIVAILTREPGADLLTDRLEAAETPITSPVAIFEAALGLARKRHASIDEARRDVGDFMAAASVVLVPITARDADTALDAFSRYGKGRGHPAQLNLGDCFAYAVAKNYGTSLLFKGDDFGKTDIDTATLSE